MSKSVIITIIIAVGFFTTYDFTVALQLDSPEIVSALEKAEQNRPQIELAIEHFQHPNDSMKYQALLFLIANMEEQCYATYRLFDTAGADVPLDVLSFPDYDSLTRTVRQIENERGELDYEKSELIYDLNHITADFLINQIDYAFKAWREKPWAKNFDFSQFCRYILPYRGSNEPLEPWRKIFYEKYDHIEKHMKNPNDPLEAAAIINDDIKTWFGFDPRFYYHPTDQGLSEMMANKLGRCEDMTNITIYAMRANGLAVTSDYTPYWANSGNNHAWNSIVTAEGDVIPFMGAEASPGKYQLHNKVAKVYRKTYDQQKDNLIFQENTQTEVPRWLKGKNYMDVTKDYTDVADVTVNTSKEIADSIEFNYLCVFNSGHWQPIHWAKMENNQAVFNDMGLDVAYLPAYYINKEIVPSDAPFILLSDSSHLCLEIHPADLQTYKFFSTTKKALAVSTDGIEQAAFSTGKSYELFYWGDDWQSLGKQTAVENKPLVFKDVPAGALYWLVEDGSDKEERIFTIDKNGKQVWW